MGPEGILESLKRLRVPHDRIAASIGRDRTAATKMLAGTRSIKGHEIAPLLELVREFGGEHTANTPDLPPSDPLGDYVEVEVLPTFAGMGGPGTGDGDRRTALLSRHLVRDELRANPSDLLIIDVRGTSMEPMFFHGDQVIVDRRDTSPTQPGPFAVLYPDGYVVKLVTWVEKRQSLRLSSANPEFPPEVWAPDEVQIIGRPVWFARRL